MYNSIGFTNFLWVIIPHTQFSLIVFQRLVVLFLIIVCLGNREKDITHSLGL